MRYQTEGTYEPR